MSIDGPVRLTNRTQTEVVAPTRKNPIELGHLVLNVAYQPTPAGLLTDGTAYLSDALPRRPRTNITATRLR